MASNPRFQHRDCSPGPGQLGSASEPGRDRRLFTIGVPTTEHVDYYPGVHTRLLINSLDTVQEWHLFSYCKHADRMAGLIKFLMPSKRGRESLEEVLHESGDRGGLGAKPVSGDGALHGSRLVLSLNRGTLLIISSHLTSHHLSVPTNSRVPRTVQTWRRQWLRWCRRPLFDHPPSPPPDARDNLNFRTDWGSGALSL